MAKGRSGPKIVELKHLVGGSSNNHGKSFGSSAMEASILRGLDWNGSTPCLRLPNAKDGLPPPNREVNSQDSHLRHISII